MSLEWKVRIMKASVVALTVILLFAFAPTITPAQMSGTEQGVDEVAVVQVKATVMKVDLEKRKITLQFEDGKSKTFKVNKSVQNLDQVKVGDHLKASYTEEIIIRIGKSADQPAAASAGLVSVAPKGAKPGLVDVETTEIIGKILAVDPDKHRITIEDPDHKKKTLKVSKKVKNLDQLKPGDSIDMVLTEAMAIEIVK